MAKLDPRWPRELFQTPLAAAALTTGAILLGLVFRPDLQADSRLVWVVGFAVLAGLLASALGSRRRWTVAAFLIAIGLGLVAGLHPPSMDVAASARPPRFSGVP
ncbi:MAG: hypothetical protein AMXMBFR61_24010 [Fimbriimonadales bacterium]